ncbi:tyrosine-type recombinase/integrase [Roseospira navarrensis]|uniref:Tyrosine-type recombinase/integrase n=1 Tax=Roseospira navarrensis TaxID=140058 RepID=A0A7X2D5L6_9PROT|nr:site-specific integrase [Roseospira navarrensis]MQX37345.1 tyrosine-type recombinase/integrase [Roseospira navarrensis]
MPRTKLTAAGVARLSPPAEGQVDWFDAALPAFGLRISASGVRSYILLTRIHGKKVRLTLGRARVNADGPGLGLADARRKAVEWLDRIAAGDDPRLDRKKASEARQEAHRNTVAAVAGRFLTEYAEPRTRPSTVREYRRALLGAPEVASWQDRPVASITKPEVRAVMEAMVARGAEIGANRWLAYVRKFFDWCAEQDIIKTVPTDRVRKPTREVHRQRYLADREIPWVWCGLEALAPPFEDVFKLCLLTGQRRNEIADLRWSEVIDLDTDAPVIELPGDRTKNGQPHVVPLVSASAAILRARPRIHGSDFVFTVTGRSSVSGFSTAKRRIDAAITAAREAEGLPPLAPWVWHSLRHTVSTRLHDLGVPPHIVEAILNHVSGTRGGVAGVYNHARYLPERREALDLWARHVAALVEGHHQRTGA